MRGHVDDEDKFESPAHAIGHYAAIAWLAEFHKRRRPDYEPVPLPRIVSEVVERVKGEL